MKIEYIRNMQFGYMRVELQKPLSKTEEAMLEHNAIEGILPVCQQQENDKYLLRYDITGKQALDALLENSMADEKLLRSLLVGIYVAVKQLEKYLLSQESVLLLPETIFFDCKTETMHFCYFPEGTETLQEQFAKLMEYMLAKTDHKNILAVQMAYGVYEEIQKPSFCMEDLQVYLHGRKEQKEEDIKVVEEEARSNQIRGLKQEIKRMEPGDCRGNKPDWKSRIMAWLKEKIKNRFESQKEETAAFFMEREPDEEGATTILDVNQDRIDGVLKYEGTNALQDIFVTKVPFVIGSAMNCDGVIHHPNVSRSHAKITYQDETYFIEDLNSTNGTRVNGGLLSYKTKVSLKKNTTIYFANEPFRFV